MIKLRDLIIEALHDNIGYYIIIGTIGFDDEVQSSIVQDGKTTHTSLGYRGYNWRYNPVEKEVYWWDFENIGNYEKRKVETHLREVYELVVMKHKPMTLPPKEKNFGDDEEEYDDSEDYYHSMKSHPFGRE